MKQIRRWGWAIVASLLMAACGGSEEVPGSGSPSGAPATPGSFSAVVSFGDQCQRRRHLHAGDLDHR